MSSRDLALAVLPRTLRSPSFDNGELLWAFTYSFGEVGLAHFPPLLFTSIVYTITALLLWPACGTGSWSSLDKAAKKTSVTLRTLPLGFRSFNSDSEPIFPTTASALKLAWKRILRRTGIQDLHFHDLRHEAVSRLFERGLTAPEVALISGHKDMRMLYRYTHPQRHRILQH